MVPRQWMSTAIAAMLATGVVSCGGDDEQGAPPDTSEEAFDVAWDDSAEAATASSAVSMQLALVVDDGPMATGVLASREIDYQCGQTEAGSCPTVTATCDAGQISGAKLEYRASDACTDKEGAPIQGTVVFTRNALRDWTVDLQSLQRGGWTVDGQIDVKTASGQPWSVTLTDLTVQGSVEQTVDDPSCAKSCVKSTTLQADIDVTVSTPSPISVDVSPMNKTVTINGSLAMTGSVTGHVTVMAKGPMGGDQTAVDQDIDVQLDAQSMAVTDMTYGIPPTCTCPESGAATTTSLVECGTSTVTYSTEAGAQCPTVDVSYSTSSTLCDSTATVVAKTIQEKCTPVGL